MEVPPGQDQVATVIAMETGATTMEATQISPLSSAVSSAAAVSLSSATLESTIVLRNAKRLRRKPERKTRIIELGTQMRLTLTAMHLKNQLLSMGTATI